MHRPIWSRWGPASPFCTGPGPGGIAPAGGFARGEGRGGEFRPGFRVGEEGFVCREGRSTATTATGREMGSGKGEVWGAFGRAAHSPNLIVGGTEGRGRDGQVPHFSNFSSCNFLKVWRRARRAACFRLPQSWWSSFLSIEKCALIFCM